MDPLAIFRTIWRNKVVAIPIMVLTLVALLYVVAEKPPTYSASASVLFEGPPSPPTQAQIAADPALGKINSTNSLLDYGSLVQVADVSLELLGSSASQNAMAQGGFAPKYKAALSTAFGTPPIIDITGSGSSSAQAIQSANTVARQIASDVRQIQVEQGVNPYYMIKAEDLVTAVSATKSISGKMRSAISYLGVGIVLLLILVSLSEGLRRRRRDGESSDGLTQPSSPIAVGRGYDPQREAFGDDKSRVLSYDQRRYPPEVETRRPYDAQRNDYNH
jgi:hypothetical protein